jgi:putative intracellular protease/amidase
MPHAVLFLTSHNQLGDTGRTTGWYLPEAAHPWKVFTDAGWTVSYVSPSGGQPRMDGADLNDPVQAEFLAHHGPSGPVTVRPEALDAADIDVVVYVGGHGSMWDFPTHSGLQSLASKVWDGGGVISAVCHGPAGLVNLRAGDGSLVVAGRRVAAFTDAEEEAAGLTTVVPFLLASTLVERGAIHVPADNWQDQVVVDGRLITGQNPASATSLARAIVAKVAELATQS